MKKISLLFLLVFSLLVAGCAQSNQQSVSSKPSETAPEAKPEEKPKSDFPNRSIEMIAPFAPGGAYDAVARVLAKVVPKYLPNEQTVVVVNKPGGAGTIGVTEVLKAKPDGYTIGFVPTSAITTEPHFGNAAYSHDSFQTIMRVLQVDGFMYVKADSPWKTFEEWLEYVKQNPDQFAVSAVPGAVSLLETLNHEAGIKLKIVPFDGFAPAMTALMGGHVHGTIGVPSGVKAQLEAGEIRPLFSSSGRKNGDVPLLKEKGFNIEENKMTGIITPKGLSEDKVAILHDAFKAALEDPEVVEQLKKVDMPSYYGGVEEFQRDLTENFKIDGELLKKIGKIK